MSDSIVIAKECELDTFFEDVKLLFNSEEERIVYKNFVDKFKESSVLLDSKLSENESFYKLCIENFKRAADECQIEVAAAFRRFSKIVCLETYKNICSAVLTGLFWSQKATNCLYTQMKIFDNISLMFVYKKDYFGSYCLESLIKYGNHKFLDTYIISKIMRERCKMDFLYWTCYFCIHSHVKNKSKFGKEFKNTGSLVERVSDKLSFFVRSLEEINTDEMNMDSFIVHPTIMMFYKLLGQHESMINRSKIKALLLKIYKSPCATNYVKFCFSLFFIKYISNLEECSLVFGEHFWDSVIKAVLYEISKRKYVSTDKIEFLQMDISSYFDLLYEYHMKCSKDGGGGSQGLNFCDHFVINLISKNKNAMKHITYLWPYIEKIVMSMTKSGYEMLINILDINITRIKKQDEDKIIILSKNYVSFLLKMVSSTRSSIYYSGLNLLISEFLLHIKFKTHNYGEKFSQMIYHGFLSSLSKFRIDIETLRSDYQNLNLRTVSQSNTNKHSSLAEYKLRRANHFRSMRVFNIFNRLVMMFKIQYKYLPFSEHPKMGLLFKVMTAQVKYFKRESKSAYAFLLLSYVAFFNKLNDPNDGIYLLMDIKRSYQRKKSCNNERKSSALWINGVVAVILNLLAIPSKWTRQLCYDLFSVILQNSFRNSSWGLIYNAIKNPETVFMDYKANSENSAVKRPSSKTQPPDNKITKHETTNVINDRDDIFFENIFDLMEEDLFGNLTLADFPQNKKYDIDSYYRSFISRVVELLNYLPKCGVSHWSILDYVYSLFKLVPNMDLLNKAPNQDALKKYIKVIKETLNKLSLSSTKKIDYSTLTSNWLINLLDYIETFVTVLISNKKSVDLCKLMLEWFAIVIKSLEFVPGEEFQILPMCHQKFAHIFNSLIHNYLSSRNPILGSNLMIYLVESKNIPFELLIDIATTISRHIQSNTISVPQVIPQSLILRKCLEVLNSKVGISKIDSKIRFFLSSVLDTLKSLPFSKDKKIKENVKVSLAILDKVSDVDDKMLVI